MDLGSDGGEEEPGGVVEALVIVEDFGEGSGETVVEDAEEVHGREFLCFVPLHEDFAVVAVFVVLGMDILSQYVMDFVDCECAF